MYSDRDDTEAGYEALWQTMRLIPGITAEDACNYYAIADICGLPTAMDMLAARFPLPASL